MKEIKLKKENRRKIERHDSRPAVYWLLYSVPKKCEVTFAHSINFIHLPSIVRHPS